MARRRKPQRGILLLVVLSMLVLFVLAGLTFVVVATQYRQRADLTSTVSLTGDDPRQLLDSAMYQVLRDTTNLRSSVQMHSLLRDMYGNDGFQGTIISSDTFQLSGQFWGFGFISPDRLIFNGAPRYNGAVITMINGPAKGISSRVVRFTGPQNGAPGTLFVEAFVSDQSIPIQPRVGDSFVVNGLPFNGSGFGYNPATNQLDLAYAQNSYVALLPNYPAIADYVHQARLTPPNYGGADEGYDAVDFQNMVMAKVPSIGTGINGVLTSRDITPSFHRPYLINYWVSKLRQQYGDQIPPVALQQVLKQVVLRPTQMDSPNFPNATTNFTGGNAGPGLQGPLDPNDPDSVNRFIASLLDGPWDVDNDGDSIADSIWIDLGFPVTSARDGRLYKPLFAILCQDLDGRLNVNVHGNLANANRTAPATITTSRAAGSGGANQQLTLSQGSGGGPAEVNLATVFGPDAPAIIRNRYVDAANSEFLPGQANNRLRTDRLAVASGNLVDERASWLKEPGIPSDYVQSPRSYGSPPDSEGTLAVYLDHTGHPVFVDPGGVDAAGNVSISNADGQVASMRQVLQDETQDDPYEINVLNRNASDTPYSVNELERLLRWADIDVTRLPDRLVRLAPSSFANPANPVAAAQNRRLVTTHSFDIPVPNIQLPRDLRDDVPVEWRRGAPRYNSVADWMALRLAKNGLTTPQIARQLQIMLPFEILRGGRMDLNRIWGDSEDDNSNGTVDEPDESSGDLAAMDASGSSMVAMDYTNDHPELAAAQAGARQLFARNLYCLMMLLLDEDFAEPTTGQEVLSEDQKRKLTARRIAQWAINVVDFRDPDAIMTPFEFDVDPFNGWDVDGELGTNDGTDRRIVWGAEYPDLVMTETLAFHDRRVKDTQHEAVGEDEDAEKRLNDQDEEADPDLDQYRIPQGSLFIELYCTRPRYDNNPVFPRELYTVDHNREEAFLDLGRMAPASRNNVQYPVWRIVISRSALQENGELWDFDGLQDTNPDTASFDARDVNININATDPTRPMDIEREIWFGNQRPSPNTPAANRIFFGQTALNVRPYLRPAHYAVVGPRNQTVIGSKPSLTNGNVNDPSAQQIIMDPQAGVFNHSNLAGRPTLNYSNIQPPLPIITAMPYSDGAVNWSIGVNVSEPMPIGFGHTYYDLPTRQDGAYDNPELPQNRFLDNPLDSENNTTLGEDFLLETGTILNYRTACLQRLANPLQAWNPAPGQFGHNPTEPINPYITVDWMPIDLTVFNGEDNQFQGPLVTSEDEEIPFDPSDPDPEVRNVRFGSRQRTGRGTDLHIWTTRSLPSGRTQPARPNIATIPATPQQGVPMEFFPFNLQHTLGYLNQSYHPPLANPPTREYRGDPSRPFPWMTWLNRPFVSNMELMLVPSSSPSRLLFEFGTKVQGGDARTDPYEPPNPAGDQLRPPYPHLVNFLNSKSVQAGGTDESPEYYRIFDLVEVPSRFVGTEKWFNESVFTNTNSVAGTNFRPPFNNLSRFRAPGLVNINTIFDPRVWQAIAPDYGTAPSAMWDRIDRHRRLFTQRWPVYSPAAGTPPGSSPAIPSEFPNPFRSANGADLHADLLIKAASDGTNQTAELTRLTGVDATLLRARRDGGGAQHRMLLGSTNTAQHASTRENPYFDYQTLQRIANITTNHSNVYAIWVTVGFFEIDPDTRELGQELYSDTGDIKRHRAFYVIDRSIPVAFEPGQNHNVDKAVILRRFIE